MDPILIHQPLQSRRQFLRQSGMGLGATAMATLLPRDGAAAVIEHPHFTPQIKRVIFLFMAGAPSQLDLFDYKPDLAKHFQQPLPPEVRDGQRLTAMTKDGKHLIQPSMFQFSQQGECGMWWSNLLPHMANAVDDLCVIRSMHTDAINHDPGKTLVNTGSEIPGNPSLGAWLSYGLGSLNRNLPDFIVLTSAFWSGDQQNVQSLYKRLWGNGFLPSQHQGVLFQSAGDPVLFLSNPSGVTRTSREKMLDLATALNRKHAAEIGDPEIHTTIAQQEMAFRMQASVPQLSDLSAEPQHVLDSYGPEVHKSGSYARNCLLARRMVERDVRFVQVYHRGWDHHVNLPRKMRGQCQDIDQPTAALLKDLKTRGLLKDTLVVFGGEFGRTVYGQGTQSMTDYGRDHHPRCFTAWLAGGGVQGGIVHGQTDEYSYNIVDKNGQKTTRFEDDAVHVRDLNATILYLLGIDHNQLTFSFQGLDHRPTGVKEAHVVEKILV